jgi:hypothetical protein
MYPQEAANDRERETKSRFVNVLDSIVVPS